jgi:hypothetical protein
MCIIKMNFENRKNQPELQPKEFEINSKQENHILNCRSTSTGLTSSFEIGILSSNPC